MPSATKQKEDLQRHLVSLVGKIPVDNSEFVDDIIKPWLSTWFIKFMGKNEFLYPKTITTYKTSDIYKNLSKYIDKDFNSVKINWSTKNKQKEKEGFSGKWINPMMLASISIQKNSDKSKKFKNRRCGDINIVVSYTFGYTSNITNVVGHVRRTHSKIISFNRPIEKHEEEIEKLVTPYLTSITNLKSLIYHNV